MRMALAPGASRNGDPLQRRNPRQRPPDDELLDLGGAVGYRNHHRLAGELFDQKLGGDAVATVNLHALPSDRDRDFGGEVLGHRGLHVAADPGIDHCGSALQQQTGGVHASRIFAPMKACELTETFKAKCENCGVELNNWRMKFRKMR